MLQTSNYRLFESLSRDKGAGLNHLNSIYNEFNSNTKGVCQLQFYAQVTVLYIVIILTAPELCKMPSGMQVGIDIYFLFFFILIFSVQLSWVI